MNMFQEKEMLTFNFLTGGCLSKVILDEEEQKHWKSLGNSVEIPTTTSFYINSSYQTSLKAFEMSEKSVLTFFSIISTL